LANNGLSEVTVAEARALLAAGFRALEERKQEINDLNVYPVPDGDTGTNLAMTVGGMLGAVERLPDDLPARELCAAVSQAALMGARGNSGVILSQIIRGAMEVLGKAPRVDSETLADVLRHATETAYRAVRRPVEGTMLTVLRDMADAAARVDGSQQIAPFMDEVIAAGWQSVANTPALLRVLADAGVVDAGGYGLVVFMEGAATGGGDWDTPISTHVQASIIPSVAFEEDEPELESIYTYCTSFLLSGTDLDQASIEESLGLLGDSLLVVGDDTRLKVHLHTDDPGRVLSIATGRGVLSEIEIDNMREQTAARSRRLSSISVPADVGLTQVVAVVAGEGNKELFRNLGVDFVVDGGQSMNPSAQDLLDAMGHASAPSVIILPNNPNVVMTAEQTSRLSEREVLVVPAKSMQAGLSAAVVYDRRMSGRDNAEEMNAALDKVAAADITRAVRDSMVDGVSVKAGDFIGLVDDRVVIACEELEPVVSEITGRLLEEGREMLTVLLGEGDDVDEARSVIEDLRSRYPGVEIDVHRGGQPFYPLLLAAE